MAMAFGTWLALSSHPAGGQATPAKTAELTAERLALVPADDRPVNLQDVALAAATAGVEVVTPPRTRLGGRVEDGDADGIVEWIDGLDGGTTDAVVVSIDMLAYGGVPASRQPVPTQDKALERLRAIERLAARRPGLPIYAFGRLLRLAPAPVPRRAAVLSKVERWAALAGTTDPAEAAERNRLREQLPPLVLDPYLAVRARDTAVTLAALDLAAGGAIRYLVLESGEEPRGLAAAERADVEAARARPALEGRTALVSAADGIDGLLIARALDDLRKRHTGVQVEGAGEGVRALVGVAGARPVSRAGPEDVTLLIASPASAAAAADAAERARRLLDAGGAVALADVAGEGSERQGASIPLVEALRNRHLFPRLLAYAAEGAADRTVAAALCQALLASAGLDVVGARTAPAAARLASARTLVLLHRLVVDFVYQAVVRPEAEADYAGEHRMNPDALDPDQRLRMQDYLTGEVKPLAESLVSDFAASTARRHRGASAPIKDIDDFRLTLPWARLADPEIRFTLVER